MVQANAGAGAPGEVVTEYQDEGQDEVRADGGNYALPGSESWGEIDPFAGNGPSGENEPQPPRTAADVRVEEVAAEMVETSNEIKELESRIKEKKARYAQLETVIVENFARMRISSMKMSTGQNVHIRKDTYASLVKDDNGSHDGAHQALRDNGLGWLVDPKVNLNSLSGWCREQEKQEQEIPESILPFLKISQVFRVRVLK